MAFTGAAVVTKVTDNLARITGVSLAAGAAGLITLAEGTAVGGVRLPDGCNWSAYADIDLIEATQILINPVTDVANFSIPIRVVKTGATNLLFQIELTNDEAAVDSAELEIYVRFH